MSTPIRFGLDPEPDPPGLLVRRRYTLVAPIYLGVSEYPALAAHAIQEWQEHLARDGGTPLSRLVVTFPGQEAGRPVVEVVGDALIPAALADRLDVAAEPVEH